ncbi:MAG: SDR family oxidoreductase [Myxococcota bacterium]|nr:SDR family oxidoreductase [Myxococcota bacterium]
MKLDRYPGAALVTGASSGLGEVFAHRFAEAGKDLVIVARRREKLETLAATLQETHGVRVLVVAEDLSKPGARQRIRSAVDAAGLSIGLLNNNAGFGRFEPFEAAPAGVNGDMVRVNCVAPVELTQAFVPDMLARGSGSLVFVASTASFLPTPWMSVYGATKAFDLLLAEALYAEYQGRGIDVLAVCPGVTETGFQDAAGVDATPPGPMVATAEDVVDAALLRLHKGPSFVHGWANQPTALFPRLFPRKLVARIAGNAIRRVSDKLKELPEPSEPSS